MTRTSIRGEQITDDTVYREDLNIDVTGRAVITKAIAGNGSLLAYTGVDAGTGDVTITAHGYSSGLYYIATGLNINVPLYYQMTTRGGSLTMVGDLTLGGQLYVVE